MKTNQLILSFFLILIPNLSWSLEEPSMSNPYIKKILEEQMKQGLVTLKEIPKSSEIKDLKLYQLPSQPNLDIQSFKALLDSAEPIEASDPTIISFHLSPLASGQFTTSEGRFEFTMFLAGRGKLIRPDGKFGWFQYVGKGTGIDMQNVYPDFLAIDSRKPVTFKDIESSPDDLQIVVFKVKQIEWLKVNESAQQVIETAYENGKAKIQVMDVVCSEGNRLKLGDELWLSGRRVRDRKKYVVSSGEAGPIVLGPGDEVILIPNNQSLFIAMLKQTGTKNLWEATRIQGDIEDAWSGGQPMAGFRDQLREIAERTLQKRQRGQK